jgi:PKD repeat protein
MSFTYIRRAAIALVLLTAAGCTVKSTDAPPLSGPSGLALSLRVNAIPDSINQDGGSQSSVKITAIGPDGKAVGNLPLRLDMAVDGVSQDYGTLSARSVVTGSDGIASVVYTAPPSPVNGVFGTCSGLPGNCVSIVATATSTSFITANPEEVLIRLMPTGTIRPPASNPIAAFTYSPTPVNFNVPVIFDASTSTPGAGASSVTSYAWNFGDGTTGSGKSVTHSFSGSGTSFNVTLTVTNDRGLSASTSQTIAVSVSAPPAGDWVYSPALPNVNETVLFNADAVKAAPGHTLVQFTWNFGDPNSPATNTASGFQASHIFSATGSYSVVLSVADETGQKTVLPKTVVIGSGNPAAVLVVSKTGGNNVQADASGSTSQSGTVISTYTFSFGDGSASATGSAAVVPHTYVANGTYTVRLTVTDTLGRSGTTTSTVTVP